MTTLHLPPLVDVHVHLRDPGAIHKEDFTTGTAAALAGGIAAVLDMPNNTPPIADEEGLASKEMVAAQKALCDYGLFLGATGSNAQEASRLGKRAVGLKIYLGQTYGPLYLQDLPALLAHFQGWRGPGPIAIHAEGVLMAAAMALAWAYGRRVHLCHVSRAAEIALIRRAKEKGAPLTCEVTPHHLFLTENDIDRLGPYGKVSPPLGQEKDQAALWENLEAVDVVASDHAPHTREEKEGPEPPPGMPGLETLLPLLLTAVTEGRLTLERLVELTHHNPARIFGLRPPAESGVEIDPQARWTVRGEELWTKCGWSPFEGMSLRGRVRRLTLRGTVAYEEGQILVRPGFGRPLERSNYKEASL